MQARKEYKNSTKNIPYRDYKREKIDSLNKYSSNSRTHSSEQVEQVARSIREFGFNNPVLVDEQNTIIAGHCRVEAAKACGMDEVPCIVLEGLTDDQKAAYVIADNKLALNAGWDFTILSDEVNRLQDNGFDVTLTGFTLDEIMDFIPEPVIEPGCDEDDVPETSEDPTTKIGDIWILGNHRLMCGDSTMINDVEKLMDGAKADMVFTDPPYNTGMTSESNKDSGRLWKGKGGSTRLSHMFDDSYSSEEWQSLMNGFMTSYWMIMNENSVAYICLDWRRNHELVPHIENAGFKRSNMIVWDKMVHGLGSDYKYTHELVNVCKKGKPKLDTHHGDSEYQDIWHIQRKMGKNDDHATAKPVELVERAISHASKNNEIVCDLFGGSGTTLIACEKTGRKCYMMELSPKYCDVIVARWEKFTGKKATLEATDAKGDRTQAE